MLRILQKLILTTLFAMFAVQANAMWLSPDWWEVTEQGVGTNRYAYAHGDPVNLRDPGGNATVYKDQNGDGQNTHYGEINPGDAGWGDDFSQSGIMPSTWVDFNSAVSSAANGTGTIELGHGTHTDFGKRGAPQPVSELFLVNPKYVNGVPVLSRSWKNRFRGKNLNNLMINLHNRSIATGTEWGAIALFDKNGALAAARGIDGGQRFNGGKAHGIDFPRGLNPALSNRLVTVHTHPFSGQTSTALGRRSVQHGGAPSARDLTAASVLGVSGYAVARGGAVYGYDEYGYR